MREQFLIFVCKYLQFLKITVSELPFMQLTNELWDYFPLSKVVTTLCSDFKGESGM